MDSYLPMVPAHRLSGHEVFKGTDMTVLEFWRWALSDLRMNTIRPMVAEFLVARAVGDTRAMRVEWSDYEVLSPEGIKIEVKSSGYCQSWRQTRLSSISFGRFAARSWDPETGKMGDKALLRADVFVFAVQACRECERYDPLDVGQWEFYVVAGSVVREHAGRTWSLTAVQRFAPRALRWSELREVIVDIAQRNRTSPTGHHLDESGGAAGSGGRPLSVSTESRATPGTGSGREGKPVPIGALVRAKREGHSRARSYKVVDFDADGAVLLEIWRERDPDGIRRWKHGRDSQIRGEILVVLATISPDTVITGAPGGIRKKSSVIASPSDRSHGVLKNRVPSAYPYPVPHAEVGV